MNSVRYSRSLRTALLTSVGLCLSLTAGTAYAQEATISGPNARPTEAVDAAHNSAVISSSQSGYVSPTEVVDSPNITINNNFTPTDARDPTNITGVGQFVTDAGGGSVGLCTATLINPRTVLFAAHCVNTRAATAYGAGSGGVGAAIGFETNTRANGPGQTDELVQWLLAGPNQFRTNTAQALYNISQVFWDPRSISTASCTNPTSCFIEADIATAVLDTPTRNIPTWALLFSPLPTPGTISPETGTGYHVTITGYGRNGTGTTGAAGNDFRRRVAENMLGALTSINDRNLFLFGTTGAPSRPQVLYWMDFDDPARGTITANPLDFNGFRDNALTREGLTGPGDSGGPLILDRTFSKSVVIGTLSGGSTFFGGQPGGSYGTQSFYQPLFLYWDWIVANNPYHYVTATAGNKNWEDSTAWVTELDPMYNIILNGQLVNGLPTNLGGANGPGAPQFGEFCFQSPSSSTTPAVNECQNTDGTVRNNVPNYTASPPAPVNGVLTEQLVDGADSATIEGGGATETAIAGRGDLEGLPTESAQADPGYSNTVRPAPTLTNGLPGATNFTPNNVDGVRTTGQIGQYFDVTLRNLGVVTLNSTVTIDRFSITGAGAQLTVASGASMTSLIEVNQMTGTVLNNGTITTGGDYLLMSGLLSGSGRVNAPFLTSILGSIAPGTINGGIGTLTLNSNVTLSSGSNLLIDLGANGTSDRLAILGNANLGGTVTVGFTNTIRAGDTFTILTAAGGRSGTFNTPAYMTAILRPVLSYTPTAVTLTVTPGLYGNVVPTTDRVGFPYALLLDRNRGQSANYQPMYSILDLQNAATIRSTLEGLRPATETTVQSLGMAGVSNQQGFVQQRLTLLDPGSTGGTFASYGSPTQVAAVGLASRSVAGLSGIGFDTDARTGGGRAPMVQEGVLPEGTSGFVAGGYLKGDSAPANGVAGRDDYDGWYVAGGIETWDDQAGIGFAASYTKLDGTGAFPGTTARANLYQGSLYGKIETGGVSIDAAVTAGLLDGNTRRAVSIVGTPYVLTSNSGSLVVVSEVGLGGDLEMGNFKLTPRIAGRATHIGFSRTREEGGPMALMIDREPVNSAQGRAGLTLSGTGKIRPFVSGYYVHEFLDRPGVIGANFVGGVGGNVLFDLNGTDRDFGEVSGGLSISAGSVDLSVSAETTIDRTDVSGQAYRGSISFRF